MKDKDNIKWQWLTTTLVEWTDMFIIYTVTIKPDKPPIVVIIW